MTSENRPEEGGADMTSEKEHGYELRPADIHDYALAKQKMTLEYGILGRVFGDCRNAPTNIAGFVLVALVGAWVLAIACGTATVERTIPVITLALGYIFGRLIGPQRA